MAIIARYLFCFALLIFVPTYDFAMEGEIVCDGKIVFSENKIKIKQGNRWRYWKRINSRDRNGRTPLYYYIDCLEDVDCSREIVELFIKKGARVNILLNSQTDLLSSALESAVNYEVLDLLINNGADPAYVDPESSTNCIYYALDAHYSERELYKILELLLSKGADVNLIFEQSANLNSILMALDQNLSLNIIKLLVDFKVDLNVVCEDGFGAAHFCVMNNNLEILSFLVSKGLELPEDKEEKKDFMDLIDEFSGFDSEIFRFVKDYYDIK